MNPADVVLVMVRRVCPDSVPPTALPTDTAAATHDTFDTFDTFVRFLRDSTRTLPVVSVITAVVAYPHGPGNPARAARTTAERGTTTTGWALDRVGVRTGATGRWLSGHRKWTTPGVMAAEPWRRCSGTLPRWGLTRSSSVSSCSWWRSSRPPRSRRPGHEERAAAP